MTPEKDAAGARTPSRALRAAAWLAAAALPYAGALAAWLWIRGRAPRPLDGPADARPPAPKGRRALALAVDLLAAFALMQLPILGWILAAGWLLFRDALFDGRGLGRRLAGIRAVRPTAAGAGPLDPWASFRRNASLGLPVAHLLLAPVEAGLVLAGARRIGERLAPETLVVLDGPV